MRQLVFKKEIIFTTLINMSANQCETTIEAHSMDAVCRRTHTHTHTYSTAEA